MGEYPALVATGALELSNAAALLHLRGKSMQEAAKKDFEVSSLVEIEDNSGIITYACPILAEIPGADEYECLVVHSSCEEADK